MQACRNAYLCVYGNLESIVVKALEANAPTKAVVVRANNNPHVTKKLWRDMTRKSKLKRITDRSTINHQITTYSKFRFDSAVCSRCAY